jgi:dTDP-4-dehydrorhamnose reductase/UDP-glucose 4-epimerase
MSDPASQKILLVGATSMLGKAVAAEVRHGFSLDTISHHQIEDVDLGVYDTVVNMAYDPRYMRAAYDPELDFDRKVAALVARSGAHFVMMSTRKVYGAAGQEPIPETAPTNPIDNYGRNKLRTESEILGLLGRRCTILRLSNAFWFELGRHTFFGIALENLRHQKRIVLDANPFVKKDFIPLPECAAGIVTVLRKKPSGIFNLGYGTGTEIGRIAMWLIEGYGEGELLVTSTKERDGFLLDNSKLCAVADMPKPSRSIRDYCMEIGKRLRNA